MNRLSLALAAFCLAVGTYADNSNQSVGQVNEAMSLTADVDLHITGAEPFTETGSIDIVNTEHAVVIFDALKPSLAKAFLSHIMINGEAAQDNRNCQLKLYNRGAIILPYGGTSFRPLTVFEEAGFGGESDNNFTEGHSNGFMKNVPNAWNNRIKSFRLKRGYMVTFALKKGGYGYSRCFIAADKDLEMDLPPLMAGRISSYRLFKWYDANKVALANDTRANSVNLLNVTSCYSFGKGESRLPDAECIPHHIYEDWPSSGDCGNQNYSCHLKTNNEPGNSADDHPQSVQEIINNWENLMRTGLRLCSPSSHDGSLNHLRECLDEIDKRGWRCDIIDLHCYWPESSFNTWSFYDQWANRYGRPIWISEWVWGASWNSNGAFANGVTEAQNREAIKRITNNLNSWDCIERYFYWNSERDPSKILRDDALTTTGAYYATINSGLAYSNYGNYIPKAPPTTAVSDLTATFKVARMTCTLEWTHSNGDLSDKVQLQRRAGTGRWDTIAEWTGSEIEDKTDMSYTDEISEPAAYEYRVVETTYNGRTLTSNSAFNPLAISEGTADIQYGTISSVKEEENIVFFAYPFEEEPVIVMGSPSYITPGLVENYMAIQQNSDRTAYTQFKMRFHVWQSDKDNETTSKVTSHFIAAKPGRGKIGAINYEAGRINDGVNLSCKRVYEVTFSEPFATTPVVMCTPKISTSSLTAVMWRIFDVTPEGFKIQLLKESSVTNTIGGACGYIAFEEGRGSNGIGTIFNVGSREITFGRSGETIQYGYDDELINPRPLMQLQTNANEAAANLRFYGSKATDFSVRMMVDKSDTEKVLSSTVTTTERVGFITLSEGEIEYDAIAAPRAVANADSFTTLTGIRLQQPTRRGIYIIGGKKVVLK